MFQPWYLYIIPTSYTSAYVTLFICCLLHIAICCTCCILASGSLHFLYLRFRKKLTILGLLSENTECLLCTSFCGEYVYLHYSVLARPSEPALSITVNLAASFPTFVALAAGGRASDPRVPAASTALASVTTFPIESVSRVKC